MLTKSIAKGLVNELPIMGDESSTRGTHRDHSSFAPLGLVFYMFHYRYYLAESSGRMTVTIGATGREVCANFGKTICNLRLGVQIILELTEKGNCWNISRSCMATYVQNVVLDCATSTSDAI
jgi:hypothetical protein